MPDRRGNLTFAEVLLDLAQQPDRLLELEDAESRDAKIALLREWYPDLFTSGREAFLTNNLTQIRLTIEGDYAASDSQTIRITFVVVTF
jgi:hypothetical protein